MEQTTKAKQPYVMEPAPPMNAYRVFINDVQYSKHAPFPLKWAEYLDERLNEGRFSLKHVPVEHFPMFSKVRIEIMDKRGNNFTKHFLIASDDSNEIINKNVYNHEITLIEQTKLLERIVVDSITFTNDLGRSYTKGAISAVPIVVKGTNAWSTPTTYKYPLPLGEEFVFVSSADYFGEHAAMSTNSAKIFYNDKLIKETNKAESFVTSLNLGTYRIEYNRPPQTSSQSFTQINFNFQTVQNQSPLPRWNIATVIDRVLDLAETHIEGVSPRFKLSFEQRAEFEQIEAPEFAFTRSTLKEVLDQIGGYIHGIPRLEDDTIYYDMLGGVEIVDLSDVGYVSKVISQNVENYATKLDCSIDNVVSIASRSEGTIVEPYNGGYKTVRTEKVYARIEEGNMCIETQRPIQEIISIECGYLEAMNSTKGGDITPYVFESADYARLSSFEENYPTSRAYAIYYTQGQKNIYGLDFKVPNASGEVFSRYAIANIIKSTSGVDMGKGWNADKYPMLAFSVSYIPINGVRAEQSKMYIDENAFPSTLVHNQGANLVESRYAGENIKGAIARIGNIEKQITYVTSYTIKIPKIGQLYDEEYYISSVSVEYLQNYFYMTLGLSRDFNRLSQYIGINSQRRYYEVSEKQAYDRDIVYTDYCVIGDETEEDTTLVKDSAVDYIRYTFLQKPEGKEFKAISNAVAVGSVNGQDLTPCMLSATSMAIGNAMTFGFKYEDNYSAGNRSGISTNGSVSGYFTQSVPYADYYGRFDNLKFDFLNGGVVPSGLAEQTVSGILFPLYVNAVSDGIFSSKNNPLVVLKDGRETFSMNYQLEFVTNRKAIIIGSALCRDCPLTSGTQANAQYATLYILPKRIGKFADKIDLSGAVKVVDYNKDSLLQKSGKKLVFANQTASADGTAWVIVNSTTGELYIGENAVIKSGEAINLPTMTFKHNIYK